MPFGETLGEMPEARIPKRLFARALRRNPTQAEERLWPFIRSSRLGVKFTRQHPIGPYVADFCARSIRLVVELDGESHEFGPSSDQVRDAYMVEAGYAVLRFPNEEVLREPAFVVDKIRAVAAERPQWRY